MNKPAVAHDGTARLMPLAALCAWGGKRDKIEKERADRPARGAEVCLSR